MADDVNIVFTADISDLQRGLRDATSGISDAVATLKSGAKQMDVSFADLTPTQRVSRKGSIS